MIFIIKNTIYKMFPPFLVIDLFYQIICLLFLNTHRNTSTHTHIHTLSHAHAHAQTLNQSHFCTAEFFPPLPLRRLLKID